MSSYEWEKLFELIGKAINLPHMTATEKGLLIRQKAIENGAEGDLDEFLSEVELE